MAADPATLASEFARRSRYVEELVTFWRANRGPIGQAFANDPRLTAQFLAQVEEAARANRRARELFARGETARAMADLSTTIRLADRMRSTLLEAAKRTGDRSVVDFVVLSPTGRALTEAGSSVVGTVRERAAAVAEAVTEGFRAGASGLGTIAKVAVVIAAVAAVAGTVYLVRSTTA